jgi:hypothetical protein
MWDGSDDIIMRSAHIGPPSPFQAVMRDSIEEFLTALNREGRIGLPSPRRHSTGAPPNPTTNISWPESILTTKATLTIPPLQATPWSDTNLSLERRCARQEGKPTIIHLVPSKSSIMKK